MCAPKQLKNNQRFPYRNLNALLVRSRFQARHIDDLSAESVSSILRNRSTFPAFDTATAMDDTSAELGRGEPGMARRSVSITALKDVPPQNRQHNERRILALYEALRELRVSVCRCLVCVCLTRPSLSHIYGMVYILYMVMVVAPAVHTITNHICTHTHTHTRMLVFRLRH